MLDFHTHHLDAPAPAIVSLPSDILRGERPFIPRRGIGYAVGIHPWETEQQPLDTLLPLWEAVEQWASHPSVVMIGETGLDALRGDVELQLFLLERHIALSEQRHLPIVLHNVRTSHHLLALRRRHRPTQPWIVHGFRGKPQQAQQLLDAGFDLSFSANCNPETLKACPLSRLHLETDDSSLSISEVYNTLVHLCPTLSEKDFSEEIAIFLSKHLVE